MLGGEPTLHTSFQDIIGIIKKCGLKTTVSSNGQNPEILEKVMDNNEKRIVNIGISIHSDEMPIELHDFILKKRPILKTVCTKNMAVPDIWKRYIGLSGVEFYLLYMDTLFADELGDSLPFYEFYKKMIKIKKMHKKIDSVFCSGFIPDKKKYPLLENVRCPAGTTKLSILPDGTAYPCYLFFGYKNFRLGNILNDRFDDIWGNPLLDFFRSYDKNNCCVTDCELFSECHGGCPAVSYSICNDLSAPDPRCIKA